MDTIGTCTVNVQRIPGLDAVAWRAREQESRLSIHRIEAEERSGSKLWNSDDDENIQDGTSESTWPTVDPDQRLVKAKQHEEAARREYFMGVSNDRAQYRKLLNATGIIEDPKTEPNNWSSDEENLAEDLNALSETESFVRINDECKGSRHQTN